MAAEEGGGARERDETPACIIKLVNAIGFQSWQTAI